MNHVQAQPHLWQQNTQAQSKLSWSKSDDNLFIPLISNTKQIHSSSEASNLQDHIAMSFVYYFLSPPTMHKVSLETGQKA